MTNVIAWTLALLLHAGVIGAFFIDWGSDDVPEVSTIEPYYIEASLANENPHTARKNREETKRQQTRARKEAARQAAINKQQILDAAHLKALEDEKARLAAEALAKKQAEELRLKQQQDQIVEQEEIDREEQFRGESEDELQVAIRLEAEGRRAVTDDEKAMAYVAQIQSEIIQNWSRPPSARNGMQALLRVFLVPTGEVVDVSLLESSGNDAFDRSALLAVRKAERFLVPSDLRQFERNFREFEVLFRPEDLRL